MLLELLTAKRSVFYYKITSDSDVPGYHRYVKVQSIGDILIRCIGNACFISTGGGYVFCVRHVKCNSRIFETTQSIVCLVCHKAMAADRTRFNGGLEP